MKRLLLLAALIFTVSAQPATVRVSPVPHPQFFDNSGRPLAGGHLCTYAAGTTTPLATYTDSTGSVQNGVCIAPGVGGIVLDSGGFARMWLVPGTGYKFVLYDKNQNLISTDDNVLVDPATPGGGFATFDVRNYGATGNGTTDDTAAYNSAVVACTNNKGGTIFFGPGQYKLTSPQALNGNPGNAYQVCSLRGTSATSTRLILYTQGITLSSGMINPPFYGGEVTGIQFEGTNLPSGAYELRVYDSAGWRIHDAAFANTAGTAGVIGIQLECNAKWLERNYVTEDQFGSLFPAINVLFDAPAAACDVGYSRFINNHFQVTRGTDAITVGATGALTTASGWQGNVVKGMANFIGTTASAANFLHFTANAVASGMTVIEMISESIAASGPNNSYICADSGAVLKPNFRVVGTFEANTSEASTCVGGQNIPFTGSNWGFDFNSARQLEVGAYLAPPQIGGTNSAAVWFPPSTVAGLPTCGGASAPAGSFSTVTNNNSACAYGGTPTGGGTTNCPVWCSGSAWVIH